LISADWVGCSGLQGQDFCFSAYFHSFPLISADCCDSGVVVWHKRADGVRGGQVKRLLISEDWVGCSGLQGQDFYCSAYFRSFPPILAIRGWSSGPGRAGGGCGGQVKRFLTSADWVGFSGLQRQDFYCAAYFRSFPPIVAIRGWSSGPGRAGGGCGGQVKRFLTSADWVGFSGLQRQDFYCAAYFRSFPPIVAIRGWSSGPDRAGGGRGGQVKRFLISEDWVGCSGLQGQDFYFSAYFRSFPPILAIPGWSLRLFPLISADSLQQANLRRRLA
jgi:hypothetical protein